MLRNKFHIQIGTLCPGSNTCHADDHILMHSIVIQLPEHTVLFTIADCPFLGKQTKMLFLIFFLSHHQDLTFILMHSPVIFKKITFEFTYNISFEKRPVNIHISL